MLISLSISQATFRKLDRQATKEVTDTHEASTDAGRFNKQTIDKAALLPIQQIASKARDFFDKHTLPWGHNGINVVSSVNYFDVVQKLGVFQHEFNTAVDAFCAEYDVHRERARFKLNSLFNEADYPPVSEVRNKFAMSWSIMPLPTAGDFRVEMADDAVAEIRSEIEGEINGRVQAMMGELRKSVASSLAHLSSRLKSSGHFHTSAIENVVDLMNRLPGLNIFEDVEVAAARDEVVQVLSNLDKNAVKKDTALREIVANSVDAILAQMRGVMR
jgi:hypothetical protein